MNTAQSIETLAQQIRADNEAIIKHARTAGALETIERIQLLVADGMSYQQAVARVLVELAERRVGASS